MGQSVQKEREIKLTTQLENRGLISKKGLNYHLFMLGLSIYKFARRKYFQIKEFPHNLHLQKTENLRFLVHINGGLGDALCARNLLFNLRKFLPKQKVSLYISCKNKEIFDTFFKQEDLADFYISRGYFLKNFDVVLSGCTYLEYEKVNYKKLKDYAPQFLSILQNGLTRQKKFSFFIKGDPYTDKLLTEKMISLGINKISTPLFFAGFEKELSPLIYKTKQDDTLQKFNLTDKKYIVIHYENGEKQIKDFAPTRPWLKDYWQQFIKLFKQKYPSILLVQVGGNIPLQDVDLCLCNKTNLTQLAQIINNALFFIGGEGAPAHLAGFLDKKSIVLYGASPKEFLSYKNNKNIFANVCTNCLWVNKNWRSACALGYKTPPCMAEITPTQVLQEVEYFL